MLQTLEELENFLEANGMTETKYFVTPYFIKSIVGYTDGGSLVYDYNKMIESAMEEENWTDEEAIDWIEYNTLRTIPYMGSSHPIVIYTEEMFCLDDDELSPFEDKAFGVTWCSDGTNKLIFESNQVIPEINEDKYIIINTI